MLGEVVAVQLEFEDDRVDAAFNWVVTRVGRGLVVQHSINVAVIEPDAGKQI